MEEYTRKEKLVSDVRKAIERALHRNGVGSIYSTMGVAAVLAAAMGSGVYLELGRKAGRLPRPRA